MRGPIVYLVSVTYTMTPPTPRLNLTPSVHFARFASFLRRLTGLVSSLALLLAVAVHAAEDVRKDFDIAEGDAPVTLKAFSAQAGGQLIFSANSVDGVRTAAVRGSYTVRDAIERMLTGTPLVAMQDARTGAWVVKRRDELKAESSASPGGAGEIRGRVLNAENGRYVATARVSVDGQRQETFTDQFGGYTLSHVDAGVVTVRVSYTGFPEGTQSVTVVPEGSVEANFNLALRREGTDSTVVLDAYNVAASSDMAASDIAVNEQRYAPAIKNVVSTDSFGDFADGNVGEFAKYMPGVTLNRSGSDGLNISIGGVPPSGTPILIDGLSLASAASSNASRTIEFENIALTNISRVEVTRSPMPDAPASAIGGFANLISRSAFEQSRPTYSGRTYLSFRGQDVSFSKQPGPFAKKIYTFEPNGEFNLVVPVNQKFGFTIGGLVARTANNGPGTTQDWVPTVAAQSANFPATTPDKPYLARYRTQERPKITIRESISLSADWRISDQDTLSLGMQYSYFKAAFWVRQLNFDVGRVASFGTDFTQGAAGAGFVQIVTDAREKNGTSYMPTLRYKHRGPVWTLNAAGAFSGATNHYQNKGYFQSNNAFYRNLTIRFEQMDRDHPRIISAKDASGNEVDVYKLNNYRLESVGGLKNDSTDFMRSLSANAARDFDVGFPLTFKTGLDFRSQSRDTHRPTYSYNYVGPDGVAQSADDASGQWFDPTYSSREQIYGPKMQWFDLNKIGSTIAAHPEYLSASSAEASAVNYYRSNVTTSQTVSELITAPYVRLDARFFQSRLQFTGGVRYERTDDKGTGGLIDPTRIYQRDAVGNIVRDSAGAPVLIAPLASLAGTKLAYVERGARAKSNYDGYFPSFNVSYLVLPNLTARASYGRAINRPDFSNFLPSSSLPDTESSTRVITATNPELKPWIADSYGLALEYYFNEPSSGVASIRAYRRNISDFWGTTQVAATDDLLSLYGLDPKIYGQALGYTISTTRNIGSARVDGTEFDYRQNLTFLPPWARGLTIFGNITLQSYSGSDQGSFSGGFVARTINYGVTFSRPRFTVRLAMNMRGLNRRTQIANAGVESGTFEYLLPRNSMDASAEYRFNRHLSVFVSGRNVNSAVDDTVRYGPTTPRDRIIQQRAAYGSTWYVGVKGNF